MIYTLFELSHNQALQDKARENVDKVLAKHNDQFTYEALCEMDYIENCVNGERNGMVWSIIDLNLSFLRQSRCENIRRYQISLVCVHETIASKAQILLSEKVKWCSFR